MRWSTVLILVLALAAGCQTQRRAEATHRLTEVTTTVVDTSTLRTENTTLTDRTDLLSASARTDSTVERWREVWRADSVGNLVRQEWVYEREHYAGASQKSQTQTASEQSVASRLEEAMRAQQADSACLASEKRTTKTTTRPSWVQVILVMMTLAGTALIIHRAWNK